MKVSITQSPSPLRSSASPLGAKDTRIRSNFSSTYRFQSFQSSPPPPCRTGSISIGRGIHPHAHSDVSRFLVLCPLAQDVVVQSGLHLHPRVALSAAGDLFTVSVPRIRGPPLTSPYAILELRPFSCIGTLHLVIPFRCSSSRLSGIRSTAYRNMTT